MLSMHKNYNLLPIKLLQEAQYSVSVLLCTKNGQFNNHNVLDLIGISTCIIKITGFCTVILCCDEFVYSGNSQKSLIRSHKFTEMYVIH